MARSPSSSLNPRRILVGLCAALAITSVLPGRYFPPAEWLAELAELTVAPVQRPVSSLVRWLRGPQAGRPSDAQTLALQQEAEAWKLRSRQAEDEVDRLRRQIVQLQRGLALNPDLTVRQLTAPVIGFGSDASSTLLKVQAGEHHGIIPGSVAVFDGVNLVGRVARVESRLCRVAPITDRAAGELAARIFTAEIPESTPAATTPAADVLPGAGVPDPAGFSLACKLTPDGRGLLSGPVEWPGLRPDVTPPKVTPGMVVRLADPSWPKSAQMLVIGRIEEVQTAPSGRVRIIVRPMFDLQRLGEVTLRVSAEASDPARPGGGA